jgi:hypothetical protein
MLRHLQIFVKALKYFLLFRAKGCSEGAGGPILGGKGGWGSDNLADLGLTKRLFSGISNNDELCVF